MDTVYYSLDFEAVEGTLLTAITGVGTQVPTPVFDICHTTGGTMDISSVPKDPEPLKAAGVSFLTRILGTPKCDGVELPRGLRGTIFVDNIPHYLHPGSWAMDGSVVYCGAASTAIDNLQRIAILAAIANMTGAIEDPKIVELLSSKLVVSVRESVLSIYSSFLKSTVKPSRLAIDLVNAQVAAELRGAWFLTSGAPVEVNESWITMDF